MDQGQCSSRKRAGAPPAPVVRLANDFSEPLNSVDLSAMSYVRQSGPIGIAIRFGIAFGGGLAVGSILYIASLMVLSLGFGVDTDDVSIARLLEDLFVLASHFATAILATALMFTSVRGVLAWWLPRQWIDGLITLTVVTLGGIFALSLLWWVGLQYFGISTLWMPNFVEGVPWSNFQLDRENLMYLANLIFEGLMTFSLVGVVIFLGVRRAAPQTGRGLALAFLMAGVAVAPKILIGQSSWATVSMILMYLISFVVVEKTKNLLLGWISLLILLIGGHEVAWQLAIHLTSR